LAEQNAFRLELDAGSGADEILETDLIADFAPERDPKFLRHAVSQHRAARRRGCRTTHWPLPSSPCRSNICGTWVDLPEPVGACSTSRFVALKGGNEIGFNVVNGQPECGHEQIFVMNCQLIGEVKLQLIRSCGWRRRSPRH
jgi:hypothetical protein